MVDKHTKVALIRPGALGDIIMTLNYASIIKSKCNITYYCHKSCYDILKDFVNTNNICNFAPLDAYHEINFHKTINLVGYPLNEGYPHQKMQNHLLFYFAKELDCDFGFDFFKLQLPQFPKKIKNRFSPRYLTVQTKTGWSVYKEWWGWQKLVNMIKKEFPNYEIYQIGGLNDPQLSGIDGSFCGDSFCDNIAAQAWSKMHLGLDSVFNHTTNIHWINKGKTKSVILFGSTQANASGYPHNDNIFLDLPCQPCFKEDPNLSLISLGTCNNPPNQTYNNPKHACMAGITPENIFEKVATRL